MWIYEKKLEIPVRVSRPDLQMAKFLITQYGGPDRRKGAQRYDYTQKLISIRLPSYTVTW